MIKAGVPQNVAMAISGHKSPLMFERYNIVAEDDLDEAAQNIDDFMGAEAQRAPKVAVLHKVA
jgi:hypothetical protein